MRRLFLCNGERASLLRKVTGRIQVITEDKGVLHEGQAGCRVNRSCIDVFTLNKMVQVEEG